MKIESDTTHKKSSTHISINNRIEAIGISNRAVLNISSHRTELSSSASSSEAEFDRGSFRDSCGTFFRIPLCSIIRHWSASEISSVCLDPFALEAALFDLRVA